MPRPDRRRRRVRPRVAQQGTSGPLAQLIASQTSFGPLGYVLGQGPQALRQGIASHMGIGGGSASNGAGAGGNGGAYCEGWVTNTTPGALFDIIVGTGGAAGPSGDMAGSTGGQTSIAVHSSAIFAYAQGGGSGGGGGSGSGGSTGASANAAGGALNLQGFTGQYGTVLSGSFALGGAGGGVAAGSAPCFVPGCTDPADPIVGQGGGAPGGGGSGAASLSGNVGGGQGGNGLVMIDW